MMNDEERRKAFWLLKKYSSYTVWAALGDAYAKFVDAWERAIKLEKQSELTEFETEAMKNFWDGKKGFDKGLPLLKRGEHNVFRYRASGYLGWHAASALGYAQRIMNPQDYVFEWMNNKDEVLAAWNVTLERLRGVFLITECTGSPPESVRKSTLFDSFYGPFNFPVELSAVPPIADITVETGDQVPLDGIWEPEWAMHQESRGVAASIVDILGGGKPSRFERGCMNYLLSGTVAPSHRSAETKSSIIPVRWRLIWEDTRYRDGTIPEEESQYLAPPAAAVLPQATDKLRRQPGEVVPETGWWHTPALQGDAGMRHFTRGEHFPEQKTSQWGDIIWTYDAERQALN